MTPEYLIGVNEQAIGCIDMLRESADKLALIVIDECHNMQRFSIFWLRLKKEKLRVKQGAKTVLGEPLQKRYYERSSGKF